MQIPPLSLSDASLLIIVAAIVLLVTAYFASPNNGPTDLVINKKNLRNVTILIEVIFLIIMLTRIVSFL